MTTPRNGQALIRQAFESKLSAWAKSQVPVVPVAYENAPFIAPTGVYLRAYVLPAKNQAIDLDRTTIQRLGVFQISLMLPINTGSKAAQDLIDAIEFLFPPTDVMFSPALAPLVKVWLLQPFSAAAAIQDVDRYIVPMSAPYTCLAV